MWYVFPQLDLGTSPLSKLYAIKTATEAQAYLAHEILGPRLRDITQAALDCGEEDLTELFPGGVDDLKFKACLTLFSLVEAGTGDQFFARAASKFWPDLDNETLDLWQKLPGHSQSSPSDENSTSRSQSQASQSTAPARTPIPLLRTTSATRRRRRHLASPLGITKTRRPKTNDMESATDEKLGKEERSRLKDSIRA